MPMLAGVGLLVVCCSSSSVASLVMGGDGDDDTEAEARALCAGKTYMSLECPNADGYEVWCADDISDMPVLADAECMGTTSDTSINNGENGHCDAGGGTYLTTDGLNMGGNHRGSLYAI
jgi:hypothetical protein